MTTFDERNTNRDEPSPLTETVQTTHDWATHTPLSTTVLRAVSSVTGKPVSELEPLFTVIDPDALDALFQPASPDRDRPAGEVAFPLDCVTVIVAASGKVLVEYDATDAEK